jgi:hypothetical protein
MAIPGAFPVFSRRADILVRSKPRMFRDLQAFKGTFTVQDGGGQGVPMALRFLAHPGGMFEISPTFQGWVPGHKRPESRRDDRDCAVRRSSLRDYSHIKRILPTLKRWAIIACPSGTGMWSCFTTGLRFSNPSDIGKKGPRPRTFLRVPVIVMAVSCAVWAGTARCEQAGPPLASDSWSAAELFTNGVVSRIHIEISPQDLAKLRQEAREFVRAMVIEAGAVYRDVAVHLKGSVGSFRPLDDKPALTLDFAHFNPTQKYHGLRRIHLNNSVEDPSYCSEQLGSEFFRMVDIPTPRVAQAVVELNERKLGLYVLKEGFTEDFLSCYFKKVGGNLFEPGEGHDVNQHLKKTSIQAPTQDRTSLKALAEAALEPDPTRRWNRLKPVLDLNRFIRFMAVEVMLCHRDGYCLARNNYRVYQDLDAGKMVFLPHGMDQLFGKPDLPWMPHMAGLVAQAVIETKEGKEEYIEAFRTIFETRFKPEFLTNRVNQIMASLAPIVEESELSKIRNEAAAIDERIVERHRFLESQLGQPPAELLEFKQGRSLLLGWMKADEPASGRMEKGIGPDGLVCLQTMTGSEACPSWRTKALLAPGRYRFEGRVRVLEVKALGFGSHQGAGLRISGQPRQSENVIGTSGWRVLSIEFEVEGTSKEVEFICELRASAGTAWFDCASLQVIQER